VASKEHGVEVIEVVVGSRGTRQEFANSTTDHRSLPFSITS
jgi:hypothetical protein